MVTEVERLKALHALELLDTAPEAEYDSIAELAAMIAGAPMAAVSLVDEDRQWFKVNIGIPAPETGRDVAFCHHAIEGDDIYVVPDATKDPLFKDNPLVTGEPDIRAYAGVPLRAPGGEKIGTLCVIHREPTILEDRVKERLKALGKTIEQILLIRARSREMEANNRVLEALNKVQAEFITKRGSREAFDSVLDTVLELTESRFGFIGSIEKDDEGPFLRARVISNIAWDDASMARYAEEIEDGLIFRNDGTLLARTYLHGETVITNAPSAHPHAGGTPDGHPDIESYLGLPIYWNGRLMAMIGVANREDGYDQAMVDRCQPLLTLIGNLVRAHKVESERDTAMYELAVAKGRYDLAVAGSAMGVWEYNVATDLIFVSERALAILGETPDAVYPGGAGLMQPIQDFVKRLHPADFDYGAQAMRDHIVEDKPYDIQLRMRHVDGEYRMVSISGVAERNADGKPLRMAGSMQDITDRMRLREERERNAARLAAVTELGGVGAWEIDLKAGTLFWDEITCRIHDLPPDYKPDLETAIDFYAPEARESITAAVEGGIERGESWDLELPLITATGRKVWVRALGRAVREAGETVRLVGGFQDITEDKELAAELLKRRAEADAANLAKSEFIANMSHEIRTPLHGVLATAQLLTMTELDEDQTQCVEVIQDSGQMLLGLIEEVLDFSKIETGSLTLSPHDFGLQGMINTVADNVGALARQKGLKFSVSMEHGLPDAVHGDEKRLRQVLTNLMGNAVKFTAEGGVTLSVSRVDGAVLRFEVRDTGPGIGEEDRRKIFERFAQADTAATRAHGGAGLGLAIAQNIVELSGGRIGVDSTPGEGSTFWFETPMVAEEAEQVPAPAPKPAAKAVRANTDRPGEGMRILVADDVPTNRMVVSEYLRHKGFEIALAENGQEALDQVMTDQFDAVLMDVQMPVMSGDEAIEKIRQSGESWAGMPVYALTADATRRTRERLASIGIDGYFTKPLEMEAIVDALVALKSPDGPRQAAE